MRLLTSLDGYAARLFAVLALAPLASLSGCGKAIPCEGGVAVPGPEGAATGFEQCEGGWLHRPEAIQCTSALPRATTCSDMDAMGSCTTDADCTEQPNGWCNSGSGGEAPGCYCNYGCTQDSECGADQICVCGDPVGHCATASCAADAECGGKLCATYITVPGCGGFAFACQSSADECASDADCSTDEQCTLAGDHRICGKIECVIGRPFLVEGTARVAGVSARRDWCEGGMSPRVGHLTSRERAVLAEEWLKSAQMEHASIAAFGRFSMQLLGLGAPPELLQATHAAMIDETEHAQACFALASAYAGTAVGPGRLSLEGALADSDLATVVRLAIVEGCIGETVAAVEAAEAAAHAEDPTVQVVLAKIAADEGRHAELAWRFVRWALAQRPDISRTIDAAFARALADEHDRPACAPCPEDEAWLRHGVARGAVKAELRRRVIDAIVVPAAAAMLRRPELGPAAATLS